MSRRPGELILTPEIEEALDKKIREIIARGEKVILSFDFDYTMVEKVFHPTRGWGWQINRALAKYTAFLLNKYGPENFDMRVLSARPTDDDLRKYFPRSPMIDTSLHDFKKQVNKALAELGSSVQLGDIDFIVDCLGHCNDRGEIVGGDSKGLFLCKSYTTPDEHGNLPEDERDRIVQFDDSEEERDSLSSNGVFCIGIEPPFRPTAHAQQPTPMSGAPTQPFMLPPAAAQSRFQFGDSPLAQLARKRLRDERSADSVSPAPDGAQASRLA